MGGERHRWFNDAPMSTTPAPADGHNAASGAVGQPAFARTSGHYATVVAIFVGLLAVGAMQSSAALNQARCCLYWLTLKAFS